MITAQQGVSSYYEALLASLIEGRKFVLVGWPRNWTTGGSELLASNLLNLGAAGVRLLIEERSTDLPNERLLPDACYLSFDQAAVLSRNLFANIENYLSAMEAASPQLQSALDRFDPGRDALVLGLAHVRENSVLGRRVLGPRQLNWFDLEEKFAAYAFLRELRIPVPASLDFPADAIDVERAIDELDGGNGLIFCSDGLTSQASGIRFLREVSASEVISNWYRDDRNRAVKVMPYLSGPAFSTHGIITKSGCALMPDFESIAVEEAFTGRLEWLGASTALQLSDEERGATRKYAMAVADQLRNKYQYRGAAAVKVALHHTVDQAVARHSQKLVVEQAVA